METRAQTVRLTADFAARLNRIDTVLFDFDGVLFRTIEDHFDSWNHAFGEIGVRVQWNDFAVLEGQNFYDIARQLGSLYGISEDGMNRIAEKKNKHYFNHHRSQPYPDTERTIVRFLEEGWNAGIVTGAYRDRIMATLPDTWLEYFKIIVTADDVARTKPDPEPYLTAAALLNKKPEECLVIENAPLGVRSAVTAGMLCVAVTTTLPEEKLREADLTVSSLDEARRMITRMKNYDPS